MSTDTVIVTERQTGTSAAVVVPLRLISARKVLAESQPVTVGVPLPRGRIAGPVDGALLDAAGNELPTQLEPLAHWPDGSIKWLLVDFLAPELAAGEAMVSLALSELHAGPVEGSPVPVNDDGRNFLQTNEVILLDQHGKRRTAPKESMTVEATGAIRTTLLFAGDFAGIPLRYRARVSFYAETGLVRVGLTLHNPQAALHKGGQWDLGDLGSVRFERLAIQIRTRNADGGRVRWIAEAGPGDSKWESGDYVDIEQLASGGENWQSGTHMNSGGVVPMRRNGYRLLANQTESIGRRASPIVQTSNLDQECITVAIPAFWQQFPKAISARAEGVLVDLFPKLDENGSPAIRELHELQGGEQKTHDVWIRFSKGAPDDDSLTWVHTPIHAACTAEWLAECEVMPFMQGADEPRDGRLASYLNDALAGPSNLFAKREAIDEYDWRNFGDLWGDHEQAYYQGQGLVVSHYNNQFDVLAGAIRQWLESGDPRWWELLDPLARHVIDIDIYHTDQDKAAYNGGLFWFTDHYRDAATATHRTYSRGNAPSGGNYGGGPGSEHNFATGLRWYYYLTGNRDARDAVVTLADWVLAMDDGRRTLLELADDGPTGLASMCGSLADQGPGRGAANSIQVLLDAWELTGDASYLAKCESLICRCIHPEDDISRRELLDVEKHWSYTMFLAALDRYLELKQSHGQRDAMYGYAQASFVAYARWMVKHERPYLDHPEQLEFPTEAWATQELRKANVLRLAARHAPAEDAAAMRRRGDELAERAWSDLLAFPSRMTTRAIAVMLAEGPVDAWVRTPREPAPTGPAVDAWPERIEFRPQKARVLEKLKSPLGWVSIAGRTLRPRLWMQAVRIKQRRWKEIR